jgi:tetratricopeptide (TPR) repeat protein
VAPITPGYIFTLALQYFNAGDGAQAEGLCQQILHENPGHTDALHLLGVIAARSGQPSLGCDYLRQALRINPDLAEAHGNLGNVLLDMGRPEEALASYEQVVRLRPDFAAVHNNRGLALLEMRKLDDAVASFRRAVEIDPDLVDAHSNLGHALGEQGCLEEALAHLRRALRLQPQHAEAQNNLGVVLGRMGKVTEALPCFQEALRLRPGLAWAHYNLGTHRLLLGNFEHGWPEYAWRWQTKDYLPRTFRQPLWDGGALAGKTILIYTEQGRGDTFQFIRYAPLLQERGAHVVLEGQPDLKELLSRCAGIDQWVSEGDPLPAFDVHAPLLNLPGLYGTTLATIPRAVPYLAADPARVARWREHLAALPGLKVGVCWQGNPHYKTDRTRSVPLAAFADLARVLGLALVSLQHGAGTEQLAALADKDAIVDLVDHAQPGSQVWMDTAALLSALDLVVTVDTAIAHLAGALGVPVWLALAFRPDWRWMMDREDSPWYPSMRLFRQSQPGDWAGVFSRIGEALRKATQKSNALAGDEPRTP